MPWLYSFCFVYVCEHAPFCLLLSLSVALKTNFSSKNLIHLEKNCLCKLCAGNVQTFQLGSINSSCFSTSSHAVDKSKVIWYWRQTSMRQTESIYQKQIHTPPSWCQQIEAHENINKQWRKQPLVGKKKIHQYLESCIKHNRCTLPQSNWATFKETTFIQVEACVSQNKPSKKYFL